MEGTAKIIEVLNDLIKINNDRVKGYENAANNIDSDETTLKGLFFQLAEESREFAEKLSDKVREFGGTSAHDATTVRGKIYRAWMDLRLTFSGEDSLTVLEACEHGEDAAQKAYKEAIENSQDFPSDVRQMISNQKDLLRLSHTLIRNQRDHYRAVGNLTPNHQDK